MPYRLPKFLSGTLKSVASDARIFLPVFFLLAVISIVFSSLRLHAYPNAEVLGTGSVNPPFDLGATSAYSGFLMITDGRMSISYGETMKLVDLGTYALEAAQAPAPSSTDGTNGVIGGLAHDSGASNILASQEDGDLLFYSLNNITATPTSMVVSAGSRLGPLAINTQNGKAYIANNTTRAIHLVELAGRTVSATATLAIAGSTNFTLTDAVYVSLTDEVYFTTSAGRVFYMGGSDTTASRIDVDTTGLKNLAAIDVFPGGDYLYVVDATTPAVVKISTSSHAVVKNNIDISRNPSPSDIVVTGVTSPNATYAYVSGTAAPNGGVSVIDTTSDAVLDLGSDAGIDGEPLPVSATPSRLASSSSTDGYVYMGLSTGKLGILTTNPFVTISSVTFSDGDTKLKEHQSMTITFQSNADGTYTIKSGGTVSGNGTTLVDSSGATSGSVTANTDQAVTINYDDNSSALVEGANNVYAFVAGTGGTGRRATQVTIDTPPPNVVMRSTGFGNDRVYINFDRIDVSDMSSYNIYADTDPAAVLTKTDASASVSQAASGSSQTGEVGGLTNGTLYYIAMEAVDAGGNKSPSRTNTFADGMVASASPEETVGPAGLLGEKGCVLISGSECNPSWPLMVFISAGILYFFRSRARQPRC